MLTEKLLFQVKYYTVNKVPFLYNSSIVSTNIREEKTALVYSESFDNAAKIVVNKNAGATVLSVSLSDIEIIK